MIKILIVDDEKKTREGLRKCLHWESLGIDILEEAEDGIKALDLSLKLQPDIVLCDIRMPRMNGIEFADKLMERMPDCKLIFISGHSDKDYLKSAIRLRAVNYVEKPVNIAELQTIIESAVSTIIEERKRREEEYANKSIIAKSTPILTQHTSLYFSNPHLKPDEIRDILKLASLDLPLKGRYVTILFQLNFNYGLTANCQQEHLNRFLKQIGDEFATAFLNSLSGIKEPARIISHILLHDSGSDLSVKSVLENIRTMICSQPQSSAEFTLAIGVGKSVFGIENIPISFQNAVEALRQSFYTEANSIFFFETINDQPFTFTAHSEKMFVNCLDKGSREEALAFIVKLSSDISRHPNTQYIKSVFYNLLLLIGRNADDRDIDIYSGRYTKDSLWQTIMELDTLHKLTDFLIGMLDTWYQHIRVKTDVGKNVYKIMELIQDRCADPQLSIKTISEYLHFTPTYLCILFKKGTGKTINNYITEVRIEKSKQLLKSRDITLYEIAALIGYANQKYYSSLFKKVTGLTPSEYRGRH